MDMKLIVCCVLLAVFVVSTSAWWGKRCPNRWLNVPRKCGDSSLQRCGVKNGCGRGKMCCKIGWCPGRYCRIPYQPRNYFNWYPYYIRRKNLVRTTTTRPVVDADGTNRQTTTPIQSASQSFKIQSKPETIRRSGSCDRASSISCSGQCTQDGDCSSSRKCCKNRCGTRSCGPILRSSIFVRGKK
ncbi:hypothetical protein SNE40_007213 [Patella caerulea]|uniref:WAP domain-containing protein n=1 Tax=Patella caerulea TaxID=87958 RepID=A0AAN8PTF4_PATCE